MTEHITRPKLRAALTAFPDRYAIPGRPSNAAPVVQDAHRQTQFLLSNDLAIFERAMNLQLQLVADNSKMRSQPAAALLAFWSRTFSCLADAFLLMTLSSYPSCPPLLRTACDCIAAQRSLVRDGFEEYEAWFADAVRQALEQAALGLDLGRYRAGSLLAEDPRLGSLYRLLTDLSMPHFGSTALQTAPDSSLQKLALTFGECAFHLGWAELITGWLLLLAEAQLQTVVASGVFAVSDAAGDEFESLGRHIAITLGGARRCTVEDVAGRFLFHNFRRTATGAPRRVML